MDCLLPDDWKITGILRTSLNPPCRSLPCGRLKSYSCTDNRRRCRLPEMERDGDCQLGGIPKVRLVTSGPVGASLADFAFHPLTYLCRQFFLQSRLAELPPSPSPPSTSTYKNPSHFRPLPIVSPPISTDMWASLRSTSLKAGEGVMILHSEGTYVFGDEKYGDGEAWWVGPEEVEDLLA